MIFQNMKRLLLVHRFGMNDRLSSPINSVIKELDLRDKKVKFILYSGSGKIKKAKEIIYNNFRSEVICLKEPKDNMRELDKLKKI